MFREQLETLQPVVYRTLHNALINGSLSHCYLFTGEKGTLKKETAFLLAQSLICQHTKDGWACEQCDECQRLMDNNYADFIYLDGTTSSIRNEDIMALQKQFIQTALEKAGRKVFIINSCENLTPKSANSLLKFIEEPSGSLTCIFITSQPTRVLPTIVSRCQVLNFRPLSKEHYYQYALSQNIDELSSHLLSYIVHSQSDIVSLNNSEAFQSALQTFIEFMFMYFDDPMQAVNYLQDNGLKGNDKERKSNKELFTCFLDIATVFVNDYHNNTSIEDDSWKLLLQKAHDTDFRSLNYLQTVTETRDALNRAVNIPLLIDRMLNRMTGGNPNG